MRERKNIRLPEYDYSSGGAYYVTICTKNKACILGDIKEGQMKLTAIGKIVQEQIQITPKIRRNVTIDSFVIMPNHIHMILLITSDDGRDMARHVPTTGRGRFGKPQSGTLSTIVGAIKSTITKNIHLQDGADGKSIWQGRFYEHVIRNEKSLEKIREYIYNNPRNWQVDDENSERIKP
jgi:REP element-mobilizing transposase RayT